MRAKNIARKLKREAAPQEPKSYPQDHVHTGPFCCPENIFYSDPANLTKGMDGRDLLDG